MLLPFLSILYLGVCNALATQPRNHTFAHRSDVNQIRLPCAPCAFADTACSQDRKPNAYLVYIPRLPRTTKAESNVMRQTVDFTMTNGTLVANDIPIFPSTSTDMQLPATRHWSSKTSKETEDVRLTYALHTQRVPPRAQGKLYRFTMDLLDNQGRPATTDLVGLTLVRNAEERLLLSNIRVEPAVHHIQRWKLKYWKTQVGGYMVTVKEAVRSRLHGESNSSDKLLIIDGHRHSTEAEQNLDSTTPKVPSDDDSHFQILSLYQFTHYPSQHGSSSRHFLHLLRPIIMPALLGIMAGFVACVIGFLVGQIGASIYFHVQSKKQAGSAVSAADVEEGFVSEKQRLLEMYE